MHNIVTDLIQKNVNSSLLHLKSPALKRLHRLPSAFCSTRIPLRLCLCSTGFFPCSAADVETVDADCKPIAAEFKTRSLLSADLQVVCFPAPPAFRRSPSRLLSVDLQVVGRLKSGSDDSSIQTDSYLFVKFIPHSADIKKQTVFFLQIADVWSTTSVAVEAAFKAACPIVKPSFLKPTRGETPVRSTQACFPPIHPKTKISAGLRVDLPSNGSVKKLTGASFLAEIPARLNTSKRTSLTMSCRYLKPGRSLQCIACSPKESKHALRQIGHNSSTVNSGIKKRYLRMVRYSTGDICWPRPSIGIARRKS
ncbi:hypothetical protein LXL04_012666 [Taraxacum kok-saghyz]